MTSFVAVEEVDHLFLLVLEEGLSSEPKYRSNFFKDIFLSLFCSLCLSLSRQDQFAVLYFLRTISLYTCKGKYLAERFDSTSTQKHTAVKSSGI